MFTGREGRKKKLHKGDVIRIVHIALMSHAAQVKKKKKRRGPMLKGRALYDKWDWIANKILAQ